MQDRTNLTPFLLERMRSEMIDVLAKYVEMDKEALELSFEQEGEQMALMLSIPVIRAKEEDEIKAILDAEAAAKAKAEAEETEENEEKSDSENQEVCFCRCKEGEGCTCQDCESDEEVEDVEETDEDLIKEIYEEACTTEAEIESEEISESPDEVEELEEADCEHKAKRLADEQDVADPFNASNQEETSSKKNKKK